ncbi:MAG: hypothetical protein ACTS4U_00970 [Candidatus Hodgkinia cicadicola]
MLNNTLSQCKALSKLEKANCKVQFPFGKLVNGRVIAKCEIYALLDVGLAKNAILFNNGLWGFKTLSVGNCTKVYIEKTDKTEDYVIASRRQLDKTERWEFIEQLCESGKEIEAVIAKLTRRGIRMEVCGLVGAMFWTRELIELENEIRSKSTLMIRVRATCKRYNMAVVVPSRPIEDSICRKTSSAVWTNVLELRDLGVWTHVDACNGIILLSGRPWCYGLDVINRLTLGGLVISDFVKIERAMEPFKSGDCVDLIVNFVLEVDKSLNWDRNVCEIDVACVWNWVTSLTLNERERWCDWRELGIERNALWFNRGGFNGPTEVVLSEEMHEGIGETDARQNLLWNEERLTLVELCGGFEVKRFELTKLVLGKVRKRQLSKEDESWLRKVENAWTCESGKLVLGKVKLRRGRTMGKWKRVLARLKTKVRGCGWREELDYADVRELEDRKLIDKLDIQMEVNGEGQREEIDWNDLEESCDRSDFRRKRGTSPDGSKTLPTAVEMELDSEWEKEWQSNREPSYRWKHYTETDCSLIETSYGSYRGVRALRPAYAVIIGIEVQVTLLMVAITKTLLAYVCDFSIENEEIAMLASNWREGLAVKVVPVALSFGADDVMVEVDVRGQEYLQFVNVNWNRPLIGIVAKVGATDVTIALAAGVYGMLRFELATVNFGIEVGMEVDVTIVDFNPVKNEINLEVTGEEEESTLLIETVRAPTRDGGWWRAFRREKRPLKRFASSDLKVVWRNCLN